MIRVTTYFLLVSTLGTLEIPEASMASSPSYYFLGHSLAAHVGG